MKLSLLRYFAWISLLLIAATSCRSARVSYPGEPVTAGSFEKNTYKALVTWGEREIAGLMLVKKADNGNLRIAFYNELGMTYLEGTLDRSSKHQKLVVKNIAPFLNQRPFINNFEKCIQLIFTDNVNPRLYASPVPGNHKNILMVKLRSGFSLELSPQINQINTD